MEPGHVGGSDVLTRHVQIPISMGLRAPASMDRRVIRKVNDSIDQPVQEHRILVVESPQAACDHLEVLVRTFAQRVSELSKTKMPRSIQTGITRALYAIQRQKKINI